MNRWLKEVDERQVIAWRRKLHQNPELSFEEYATADFVESTLQAFGIETTRPAKTGVLATLHGAKPGNTVMFRADMDALPMDEVSDEPFKSIVPGVAHTCGHDAHTAMLLETARILKKHEDELQGTVKLVFQHAEEVAPGGAKAFVESGAIDDIDAAFGLHVMAGMRAGSIQIIPDGMASTAIDGFFINITGKGSHGSLPYEGIDPILVGHDIYQQVQSILRAVCPPDEMAVISICEFKAGHATNIIPETAYMSGSVRTITPETRKAIQDRVRAIVENVARTYGAKAELEYVNSYPAIKNDATLSALAIKAAEEVVGEENVITTKTGMFSEDFSYYTEVAPACFVFLGAGDASQGITAPHHNPHFAIKENVLKLGSAFQVQTIFDYLNENGER